METVTRTDNGITHGVAAYSKGRCKSGPDGRACDVCRAEWAAYIKRRRHQAAVPVEDHFEGRMVGRVVRITSLADRLARAAEERTGRRYDDIVEAAIRQAVPALKF